MLDGIGLGLLSANRYCRVSSIPHHVPQMLKLNYDSDLPSTKNGRHRKQLVWTTPIEKMNHKKHCVLKQMIYFEYTQIESHHDGCQDDHAGFSHKKWAGGDLAKDMKLSGIKHVELYSILIYQYFILYQDGFERWNCIEASLESARGRYQTCMPELNAATAWDWKCFRTRERKHIEPRESPRVIM